MTIPVWPDDLPCSVIMGSLQTGIRGSRLSTAPDAGQAKLRRRGPLVRPVSCAMKVGANQRARFDLFWEEEVDCGVLPFLFRDQQLDGYRLGDGVGLTLLDDVGNSVIIESWWLVQFGKTEPSFTRISGSTFQITFDLIVLP